jgi:hypothetical protein
VRQPPETQYAWDATAHVAFQRLGSGAELVLVHEWLSHQESSTLMACIGSASARTTGQRLLISLQPYWRKSTSGPARPSDCTHETSEWDPASADSTTVPMSLKRAEASLGGLIEKADAGRRAVGPDCRRRLALDIAFVGAPDAAAGRGAPSFELCVAHTGDVLAGSLASVVAAPHGWTRRGRSGGLDLLGARYLDEAHHGDQHDARRPAAASCPCS